MLGVLWSEHCSYKSSKALLRRSLRQARGGPGSGENAGAVSIGEGGRPSQDRVAQPHPRSSRTRAPHRRRGIIRDVIAWARPIASSTRPFGRCRSRAVTRGVVAGIGAYGNCIGIPTVGGEIYLEDVTPTTRSSTRCALNSSARPAHAARRRHRTG